MLSNIFLNNLIFFFLEKTFTNFAFIFYWLSVQNPFFKVILSLRNLGSTYSVYNNKNIP